MPDDEYEADTKSKSIVFNEPWYVYLHMKDLCMELDIPKEVIMTLLSHIQSQDSEDPFIRVLSTCPSQSMIRFYSEQPEDAAKGDQILTTALAVAWQRSGVYWFSIPIVAQRLNLSPFDIVKQLQRLQF